MNNGTRLFQVFQPGGGGGLAGYLIKLPAPNLALITPLVNLQTKDSNLNESFKNTHP